MLNRFMIHHYKLSSSFNERSLRISYHLFIFEVPFIILRNIDNNRSGIKSCKARRFELNIIVINSIKTEKIVL